MRQLHALCSEKNYLFLSGLPGISANSNENYRHYNNQASANITGNFLKIHNPRYIPLLTYSVSQNFYSFGQLVYPGSSHYLIISPL